MQNSTIGRGTQMPIYFTTSIAHTKFKFNPETIFLYTRSFVSSMGKYYDIAYLLSKKMLRSLGPKINLGENGPVAKNLDWGY